MPIGLVRQVDKGFNSTVRDAAELVRGSADDGSQNVLYSRGTIKTPFGFGQVLPSELPLDSGNPVFGLFAFSELDKTQHFLAVTSGKIYNKNNHSSTWDDKTQSGVPFGANSFNPVSQVNILHNDGLALNGSGDDAFHHSVISSGGSTAIQRWAGKFEDDYADLLGADGYHDTGSGRTTHYAMQVARFQNRLLLINPLEANSNNILVENNQRVRYPQAGLLETWNGIGSGFLQLLDTGGYNVRGAQLGAQFIVYQHNSIWSINHVGGTTVFDPRVEIPDLGLLGYHLLATKNNIHFFIGNDFNVYQYFGGSDKKVIGDGIQRYLQRDLDPAYAARSWMALGAQNSRLWIFIVPNGTVYATAAYAIDRRTGAWMKRDFTHKWTTVSQTGITSVALIGASLFEIGKTYGDLLLERSPSKTVEIGGAVRSSNVVTVTTTVTHSLLVGETAIIADVDSGGEANAFSGSFEIVSVPSGTTFTYAQSGANESNLAEGSARVDKPPTSQDYITFGLTSRQMLIEVLSDERLTLGDSLGFVYQYDPDLTQDDGVDIPARHKTAIWDWGSPSREKLWPSIAVTAKGTSITISYRISDFETVDTGWFDVAVTDAGGTSQALTSDFTEYIFWLNVTAKRIQFKFSSTDDFNVSEFQVYPPVLEGRI